MNTVKEGIKIKGLYLYCIRPCGFSFTNLVKSIAGSGESFVIPVGELEAVVSEVDLDEFGSKEIQKKAEEDLNWIKEKCQIHEYVIEQAMRYGEKIIPVVPMKFGTIFKSKDRLEVSLLENYPRIKDGLIKVKGRQEWGVKIYLKKECFLKWIVDNDNELQDKRKEIEKLSQGMAFFAQKKLNDAVNRIYSEKLEELIQGIFNNISSFADEGIRAKNLEKELTGKKEEMVLNAYFLVKEEKVAEFREDVEKLSRGYGSQGFHAACIGPLPPYHFV